LERTANTTIENSIDVEKRLARKKQLALVQSLVTNARAGEDLISAQV
jgi:hypothetical protein